MILCLLDSIWQRSKTLKQACTDILRGRGGGGGGGGLFNLHGYSWGHTLRQKKNKGKKGIIE